MRRLVQIFAKRQGFFTALLAVAVALAAASVMDGEPTPRAPHAIGGVIDLTNWNFEANGRVRLEGEWRYAANRWGKGAADGNGAGLLKVPGPWPVAREHFAAPSNGFATYALTVKLPPNAGRLALHAGYVYSAYRIRANGVEIARAGTPAQTKDGEVAHVYGIAAPLQAQADTIELEIETSNHIALDGGFQGAPIIALEDDMSTWLATVYAFSIFLVGAMCFAACYHLVAFTLAPASPETFWFGAFAALMALRTLMIDPIAPHLAALLGQEWIWRIDYAATILLIPAVFHFFAVSFPAHLSRRVSLWLALGCGALACVPPLAGSAPGELALKAGEVLSLVVLVYMTRGIGRAAWEGEPGGALAFAGWLACATATVHDIMLDNRLIIGPNLIPFGFVAFFMCLSGTMIARFRAAYHHARLRGDAMQIRAEDLEAAVAKRTHELERAKAEAESASTAKSRFLATMSHELRTPLNAILGFADMIRQEMFGKVGNDRYKDYAGDIYKSGAHLLSLINDILDLSQIEAGKRILHDEVLTVADVANDAIDIAASRDRRARESVTLDIADGLPQLRADRRAVLQILVNLVTNALKFTPEGKAIALRAYAANGRITLLVKDEGVGMAPQDIPRALALFSQVDEGNARRHEGTGLGLPIVKSLMELHGGTLTLTSEKGKGTTATLNFPAARTQSHGRAAA